MPSDISSALPSSWLIAEPVPLALYEVVEEDSRFDDAMRVLARKMLHLAEIDPALAGIFKDAGRYIAAMCAASLQDEGVTLPRLKRLCAGFGLMSMGRARALLIYLRYLGYVGMWSERDGSGPARYTSSAKFLANWCLHLKAALDAAAVLDPATETARLDDQRFFTLFSRIQMEGLMASVGRMPANNALFSVFLNRHAGIQVMEILLIQGEGECPTRGPLRISLGDIARRFGVSRIHIRRMLRDAEQEAILMRDEQGALRFTEAGRAMVRFNYAAQLTSLLIAFARTRDAVMAEVREEAA
jgi:AraC-like DNA-binding protein